MWDDYRISSESQAFVYILYRDSSAAIGSEIVVAVLKAVAAERDGSGVVGCRLRPGSAVSSSIVCFPGLADLVGIGIEGEHARIFFVGSSLWARLGDSNDEFSTSLPAVDWRRRSICIAISSDAPFGRTSGASDLSLSVIGTAPVDPQAVR